MASEQLSFTKNEAVASVGATFGTLGRFMSYVPILWWLAAPTVLLSLIAVTLPQIFLVLAGTYAQCNGETPCMWRYPYLQLEFVVSVTMLLTLAVSSFIFRLLSWVVFEIGGQWAMQGFHVRMVNGLRAVRTTYFDENPSGRIINRMVNDYEHLRTSCIVRLSDSVQAFLEVLSIAGMVLIAQPFAGFLILPTVGIFVYLQWCIAPMLQRLTTVRSIRMGEVIHRETDLIDGAKTFVLYDAQGALLSRVRRVVTRYVQIHLLRVKIEAWGRFLSNSSTSLYSFLSIVLIAAAIHSGSITLVMGSTIVTILLRLTPTCGWFAWSVGMVIESTGVTKRAFQITDLPPQETEEFGPEVDTMSELAGIERVVFPKQGDLVFDRFSMAYRVDTPVILHDISCTLPAGVKVGIVGRTGSGKTSLFQSLFRFVHVRAGNIFFAGSSLFEAELADVRNLFGVVPQEPYLFSGTIRSNLDPDRVVSDAVLLAAMQRVGMELPLALELEEGGKNLSVGERQLVCLARVIVYERPIILLDEPTSAVDNQTDARIQAALKVVFSDHTVIAIAHRLETLSNYDLIIEIADGRIRRSGTPQEMMAVLRKEDLS